MGFAWFQPTSFLADEIAKDPTSPIAVSHEIARKNGTALMSGTLTSLAALVAGAIGDAGRREQSRRNPKVLPCGAPYRSAGFSGGANPHRGRPSTRAHGRQDTPP